MEVIKARDLGVFFRMDEKDGNSLKGWLSKPFSSRKRGKFWALRNLDFTLEKGEILGVIGNNGAGKSTLLRTIAGVYLPDEGEMIVNGNISPLLSLGTGFKNDLTGRENVFLNGAIMGFTRKEVKENFDQIVEFSELKKFIDQPVKTYSSGMRARLGFSIAVHLRRDIMLVDEILGVGDFRFRKKSQDKLKELISGGRTIVIVSHDLSSIKKYATKALWIERGSQVMYGETTEVVEAYLNS